MSAKKVVATDVLIDYLDMPHMGVFALRYELQEFCVLDVRMS
jgi:hypothetical protein